MALDGMEIVRLLGAIVASSAFGGIIVKWIESRKELARAKLDQQPEFIATLIRRLDALEDDRRRLDGIVERLNGELNASERERNRLELDLATLRREHDQIRREASALSEKNSKLKDDHDALKRHVTKLEDENRRLRNERSTLIANEG